VPWMALIDRSSSARVERAPSSAVFSRLRITGLSQDLRPCRSGPVQSLRVAAQLAGPARGLGPPRSAGSRVQSFSEKPWTSRFASPASRFFSHPSPRLRVTPHRPRPSHLKGSELFEILPYESEGSVTAAQVGRIDRRRGVVFIGGKTRKLWDREVLYPRI
jgi:hypothetical protein